MKRRIGNFSLEGWEPTPVEQALMNGTFEQLVTESIGNDCADIPRDFLEVQDFDAAMGKIKLEIEKR